MKFFGGKDKSSVIKKTPNDIMSQNNSTTDLLY